MKNNQLPFWILATVVIAGLTLPVLIQDGMFMDAMLYTAVSKNLANGVGTFWFPIFNYIGIGGLQTFHEHPPLVFGIQSIFFKILGNGIYTERIYVFVCCLITASLIVLIWKKIQPENETRKIGWLPLILWITIPVCFWSFQNNMQENTMGIFVLLSVLFYLKTKIEKRNAIILMLLSGVSIAAAAMCKGIPGFFPLALPFCFWLCTQRISFSKMMVDSIILFGVCAIIFGILILIPTSRESLSNYFFKRVLHRLSKDPTVGNRFYIVGRLFSEMIPNILFFAIVWVIFKSKKLFHLSTENKKLALFFLLLGFTGSVPIMLTMVQKGFYFVPSLPFFGLGFALLIAEPIATWSEKWLADFKTKRIFTIVVSLALCGVIIFTVSKFGKTSRDFAVTHDIYEIGKIVPANAHIGLQAEAYNEWELHTEMIRHFNISLLVGTDGEFLLAYKNHKEPIPTGFEKVSLDTQAFDLYRKGKE